MKINPQDFAAAYPLLERLEDAGYEAWLVGGAVRDAYLGQPFYDIDITTQALPDTIEALFSDHKTIAVGKAFGTIRVIWEGEEFELTTYRQDGEYADGRRPEEVLYSENLLDDLGRRDFTMNAMAYHPQRGLFDYYGGQEDLQASLLRAVGDPNKRLEEDALRILRGVRFQARFQLDLAADLRAAMLAQKHRLALLSRERIFDELDGMLTGNQPGQSMITMNELDLWPWLFDAYPLHQAREEDLLCLDGSASDSSLLWALFLTAWLRANPQLSAADALDLVHGMLMSLKTANKWRKTVEALVSVWLQGEREINLADLRRIKGQWREKFDILFLYLKNLMEFHWQAWPIDQIKSMADQIEEEGLATSIQDLAVDGQDLIQAGIRPGPMIGQCLDYLLELVIDDRLVNEKDALLQAAQAFLRNE